MDVCDCPCSRHQKLMAKIWTSIVPVPDTTVPALDITIPVLDITVCISDITVPVQDTIFPPGLLPSINFWYPVDGQFVKSFYWISIIDVRQMDVRNHPSDGHQKKKSGRGTVSTVQLFRQNACPSCSRHLRLMSGMKTVSRSKVPTINDGCREHRQVLTSICPTLKVDIEQMDSQK